MIDEFYTFAYKQNGFTYTSFRTVCRCEHNGTGIFTKSEPRWRSDTEYDETFTELEINSQVHRDLATGFDQALRARVYVQVGGKEFYPLIQALKERSFTIPAVL